jgi:membrane fusion protein, multidrug efflux system
MRHRFIFGLSSALVLGLCFAVVGCTTAPDGAPAAAPVSVPVSYPVEREVTDYKDFTARIAAVDSVEMRAHVWGYLEKVNFKEGALVKKGDVLFEIDPRPYQALLDQANAKLHQDEAQLKFDEAEYERNSRLVQGNTVSRSEFEKSQAAREVDLANIAADKALIAQRALDLQYTKVTAPVSGRVSRYVVTVGNLIQSGDQGGGTVLTTIVSVDPMYAYFDVDERTIQRVQGLFREDTAMSVDEAAWPVSLGVAAETGFPHQGTINFVDNQVDPKTGTMRVRAVLPNKDGALSQGYFARVRVPVARPRQAVLVTERALDNDQGQKILYVVNDKNEVVSRAVRVGQMHDGLRTIEEGLKPGERIVVNGMQQIRPGITVEPKFVAMPTPALKKSNGAVRVAKAAS